MVEYDRHVFGLVCIDEKQATEQDFVGIECWFCGLVGTDVTGDGAGGGVGQRLLLDREVPLSRLGGSRSNVGGQFSSSMLSTLHRSREQSDGMDDVLDRFTGLQKIRQYDVSCQDDIVQILSSADNTLTNRTENARFWLRKQV